MSLGSKMRDQNKIQSATILFLKWGPQVSHLSCIIMKYFVLLKTGIVTKFNCIKGHLSQPVLDLGKEIVEVL